MNRKDEMNHINKRIGLYMVMLLAPLMLASCGQSGDEATTQDATSGEVEVYNGEANQEDTSVESEEASANLEEDKQVVEERKVESDKVPKSGADRFVSGDEDTTSNSGNADTYPDLSKGYEEVNNGELEQVDYDIPYSLYFKDDHNRAIGGQAVVGLVTLASYPEKLDEASVGEQLYELELLPTELLNNEKGKDGGNRVRVTKQAYNLYKELQQNIYGSVKEGGEDNKVYMTVDALYVNQDTVPYAIKVGAKSVRGDVKFNYQINNIQEGYKVNYELGQVSDGIDE